MGVACSYSSAPDIWCSCLIDNFTVTVVCLVAWPLNESEAGVDLVLIDTLMFFSC